MTNKEKVYLFDLCIKKFAQGINQRSAPAIAKATILKEVIEKLIDCQPKNYYDKYMLIVRLFNQSKNVIF